MIIRCPRCGREGNAPDSRGRVSQTVRCRPCGARFTIDRTPGTNGADPSDLAVAGAIARLVHERVRSRTEVDPDDDRPVFQLPPQSDWQQDTSSAVLGGDPDDSQVELPAFTSAAEPSGDGEPGPAFEYASSEFALPVPWYYRFIESWGRVHFYVVIGFATSSLAVLGFLLVRSSSQAISSAPRSRLSSSAASAQSHSSSFRYRRQCSSSWSSILGEACAC